MHVLIHLSEQNGKLQCVCVLCLSDWDQSYATEGLFQCLVSQVFCFVDEVFSYHLSLPLRESSVILKDSPVPHKRQCYLLVL